MTQIEQQEFSALQEQLAKSSVSTEENNAHYSDTISRLQDELRLYRGLFWCMLAFSSVVALLNLLQR
jgi:hypothetical protein